MKNTIWITTLLALAACGSAPGQGSAPPASAPPASSDDAALRTDAERMLGAVAARRSDALEGRRFLVVPRSVMVDDRSITEWSAGWWRYILSLPAAQNPEFLASQDCAFGQAGPVFFVPGEQQDVYQRTCDIPFGVPVLLPVWSVLNDYPCPDPTFQPAPGQPLEDFLAQGARGFDDAVTHLETSIDGSPIDLARHRHTTDLIGFVGDASLTATLDGCITGTGQVGVVDGWWLLTLFAPGHHDVVTTAVSPGGHATSQTFHLRVH
jgi:hypothetical protein